MRRVVLVTFPAVQTLDVVGPAEVFRAASLLKPPGYEVIGGATQSGPVPTSTVSLVPDARLDQVKGAIDTLIVAGGTETAPRRGASVARRAPAVKRSSARSSPPRPPTARRSVSSKRGSRTTSTRI